MGRNLTTDDLAARLCTRPATVRYWRHIGYGPIYFRVGRRVLYDEAIVDEWLLSCQYDGAVEALNKSAQRIDVLDLTDDVDVVQ